MVLHETRMGDAGIGCHPEACLKMVILYRFSVSSDICSGQLSSLFEFFGVKFR